MKNKEATEQQLADGQLYRLTLEAYHAHVDDLGLSADDEERLHEIVGDLCEAYLQAVTSALAH